MYRKEADRDSGWKKIEQNQTDRWYETCCYAHLYFFQLGGLSIEKIQYPGIILDFLYLCSPEVNFSGLFETSWKFMGAQYFTDGLSATLFKYQPHCPKHKHVNSNNSKHIKREHTVWRQRSIRTVNENLH